MVRVFMNLFFAEVIASKYYICCTTYYYGKNNTQGKKYVELYEEVLKLEREKNALFERMIELRK